MTLLINSYSFIVLGLLVLSIITLLTWHLFGAKFSMLAITTTFIVLIAFQLITSTKSSEVSSPEAFEEILASGKPVLVELYSNY